MFTDRFLAVLASIATFSAVAANNLTPLNSNFEIRNSPGTTSTETMELLRRSLTDVALKRATGDEYKTNATLDTSWDDQFLFKMVVGVETNDGKGFNAGVSVTCSTCYIKGLASAEFIIQEGFSFNETFSNITDQIGDAFDEITNITVAYAKSYKDQFIDTTLTLGQKNVTVGDYFDLRPLNVDLNIDIPDVPDCELKFQFDGLELYMELDTVLSLGATYTINLFTSQSPVGIKVGDKLEVGFTFTLDLILDVQAQIDIKSGFHIKLDDGIAFNLPMFSKNVSSVTFKGGNFEFLDVSIESGGVVFKALLRVGVRAGLGLSTPKLGDVSASASIVGQLYVDVAQFKTTITAAPISIEGKPCELSLIQEYALAIGASVGYLFQFKDHAWGPILDTETAIYSTTLTEVCIKSRTASAVTSSATVKARQAFLTETTTTSITYTAVQCQSTGLINCPASLQNVITDKFDSVLTATLTSSGADPEWTTRNTGIVTTIPFKSALRMDATSGSPVPYVPGPTSTSTREDIANTLNSKTGGVSNKLILGVSLGIGIPVLIAIIAGFVYLIKRKRSSSRISGSLVEPYRETVQVSEPVDSKKGAAVNVVEYRG